MGNVDERDVLEKPAIPPSEKKAEGKDEADLLERFSKTLMNSHLTLMIGPSVLRKLGPGAKAESPESYYKTKAVVRDWLKCFKEELPEWEKALEEMT